MTESFASILNPGLASVARSAKASRYAEFDNQILIRGIVVDINREMTVDKKYTAYKPLYSVKAAIIGEDHDINKNIPPSLSDFKWYAPLTSHHFISIPEIGEEVIIIRESENRLTKGYWISRVSETNKTSRYLSKEYMNGDVKQPLQKYGFHFDVSKLNREKKQIQPPFQKISYAIPAKLGDVIQQGRSGTFIRHSFNPRAKRRGGVLEIGILEDRIYPLNDASTSIGRTRTKTIHINRGLLSDIGGMEKETKIDFRIEGPFQDGSFQTIPTNVLDTPKNLIANVAEETYNISISNLAEQTLHRHVLGEKLVTHQENVNKVLNDILSSIDKFVNTTDNIMEMFLNHTHGIPEINIEIPDKEVSFVDRTRQQSRLVSNGSSEIKVGENTILIPNAPTFVAGEERSITRTKKIEYDKITIGGVANKRDTTTPETNERTTNINDDITKLYDEFRKQSNDLLLLTNKTRDVLSKVHYLN
tara:strand:+ start:949 stop:2373 length:1425 start_codon:yes stop_codon:yes gene_type:complete